MKGNARTMAAALLGALAGTARVSSETSTSAPRRRVPPPVPPESLPTYRVTASIRRRSGVRNSDPSWRRPHEREVMRRVARERGLLLHQVLRDPRLRANFRKLKAVAAVRKSVASLTKEGRLTLGD